MTAGRPTLPSLISVVVTCYNLERYIGEAIGSVLAQVDAGAVEIIVVDDRSTDGSAQVIAEFDDVRIVRTERNCGVMLAMLAGVEAALGDLVCFLDGDDVWESGKLATVRRCFDENQTVALVTHDLIYIDSDGRPLDRRSLPAARVSVAAPKDRAALVRKGILELDDYVWLGSALCIRRSLSEWDQFVAWTHSLPDPRNTYQDWPLAYWVAALDGVAMAYTSAPLFRYRLHGANHSGDSRTVERAARNFTRTRNTTAAIVDIAEMRGLDPRLRRIAGQRFALTQAQVDLYDGRSAAALGGFARSIAYLAGRRLLAKEAMRFLAIAVLGRERFTRLLARWAAARLA